MTSRGFTDLALPHDEQAALAERARLLRGSILTMTSVAKSGHPGMPMGAAAVAHTLFTRHLRFLIHKDRGRAAAERRHTRFEPLDKIARFDPDASNHMVLQGTWKLQPVTGRETRTRYFLITVPVPSTPDIMTGRVIAMNHALEQLARRIAGQWSG